MIAVVAVVQLLAAATKRPWIMTILPFLAFAADLMVGYTPEWFPIACTFAGMLMVFSRTWQRRKQVDQVLYLVALCAVVLFATSCIFQGPAKAVAAAENKMMAFQLKLETSIKNFSLFEVNFQDGSVDNHKPTYKNKEVIHVSADENPGQIYLRGFYGTDYINHGWSSDKEAFQQGCDNYDIGSDEAALIVSKLPYEFTQRSEQMAKDDYSEYPGSEKNYDITYTGIKDAYAYLPYGVDASQSNGDLVINGDYEFRKDRGTDEIQIVGNDGDAFLEERAYPELGWDENGETYIINNDSNFTNWYDRYVQNKYLAVPDEQRTAKQIAYTLSYDFDESDEEWFVQEYGAYGQNNIRKLKAEAVLKYLLMNESYSLDLDVLPKGEDPVEYFLSTSHKGYCVHFASAAVFIIRAMGVPARYVTGYVGKEDAIQFNKDTDQYELSVKDSNAHAWVEIYMEEFGWVPIEVTPGNSQYWDSRVEVAKDSAEYNSTDTTNNTSEQNQNSQQTNQEADNLPSDSEADTMQEENSEIAATETEETGAGDGLGLGQSGSGKGAHVLNTAALLRILASAAGILAALVVAGYLIFIRPKRQILRNTKTIQSNLKRGRYQQAVNRINQSLYHDLRKDKKKIGWKKNLTDEEYIRELIAVYPQIDVEEWKRYLNIARKAAYDNRELPEEDAKFCFHIYKEHLQKEKKEF